MPGCERGTSRTPVWGVTSRPPRKQNVSIEVKLFKDAMPVSFSSELFTSYILTNFKQWNQLP